MNGRKPYFFPGKIDFIFTVNVTHTSRPSQLRISTLKIARGDGQRLLNSGFYLIISAKLRVGTEYGLGFVRSYLKTSRRKGCEETKKEAE